MLRKMKKGIMFLFLMLLVVGFGFAQDSTAVEPTVPGWLLDFGEWIGVIIIVIEAVARAFPNPKAKFIIGWVIDFLKWLSDKLNATETTYKKS